MQQNAGENDFTNQLKSGSHSYNHDYTLDWVKPTRPGSYNYTPAVSELWVATFLGGTVSSKMGLGAWLKMEREKRTRTKKWENYTFSVCEKA